MEAVPTTHRSSGIRVLLSLAAIVVIIAGLKQLGDFFTPVLLAFFLAVMSYPIVDRLTRWRFPRWLAILLTLAIDIGVLTGFGFLTMTLAEDFSRVWPSYAGILERNVSSALALLKERGLVTDEDLAQFRWQEYIATAGRQVASFAALAASFLKDAVFVLILMVVMMIEGGAFARKVARMNGQGGSPRLSFLNRTAKDIQRYLTIKTFVSAMTGLMAYGLCLWVGVDFALLWGLAAFLLNYIPAIGSIVAALPPILLAWLVKGPFEAVLVASGYFFIDNLWGNMLEPMMMGMRFGISTVVVFLSVMFWGWLWGPIGMFLSVPLTMLVKVMLDHSSEFAWLGALLGQEKKVPDLAGLGELFDGDPDAGAAEGEGVAELIRNGRRRKPVMD